VKLKITGTGRYLPELILTNEMLSQQVDTSDEWIVSRTGISERRLTQGEPTWYMAVQAARKAIEAASLQPSELDIILVTTCTPDYFVPATACIVQAELGASNAFCFDVNAACTGFIYALDMAARYLQDEQIRHVLIVSSENLSKITDYSDRGTCILFGDGASAVVCSRPEPDGQSALLSTRLGSEGDSAHVLVSRALSIQHPFLKDRPVWPDRFGACDNQAIQMDGQEVFKFAVRVLADSVIEAVEKAQVELSDLSYIIPHQANSRIVDAAARRLDVDHEKVISKLASYGNTSSASIPICLDEMVRSGQLKRGDTIALCGFGGGLTFGAAILTY
jgi:3-oxoacyl-[acyl-carrier-protein] synthase-3